MSSCEILYVNSCVSKVCYFHLWIFLILQVLWKVWYFSFNSKFLFLSYLGSKLYVSSCEIMSCVIMWTRFVIFICEFLLLLQVWWKVQLSSFISKLLFLLGFSIKLFVSSCELLWDLVWVQILCAMHIALVKLKLKATGLCVIHSYKFCDMYKL